MYEIRIYEKTALLTTLLIGPLSVEEKLHEDIAVRLPRATLLNVS